VCVYSFVLQAGNRSSLLEASHLPKITSFALLSAFAAAAKNMAKADADFPDVFCSYDSRLLSYTGIYLALDYFLKIDIFS